MVEREWIDCNSNFSYFTHLPLPCRGTLQRTLWYATFLFVNNLLSVNIDAKFYDVPVPRIAIVEYDYVARERGELSLQKGGVVTVLEQNQGWWKGDLNGNIGTFPANVRMLESCICF